MDNTNSKPIYCSSNWKNWSAQKQNFHFVVWHSNIMEIVYFQKHISSPKLTNTERRREVQEEKYDSNRTWFDLLVDRPCVMPLLVSCSNWSAGRIIFSRSSISFSRSCSSAGGPKPFSLTVTSDHCWEDRLSCCVSMQVVKYLWSQRQVHKMF